MILNPQFEKVTPSLLVTNIRYESDAQQPDGYFATFFLSPLSLTMDCWIHSLSVSLSQTTHHCSGKKGTMITFSRWDCFESKLMTFCRQNYSSPFCGSAIARDLYFLPSSPPCLLQEAILPKITLLIVVRSKAILKFKLEVESTNKTAKEQHVSSRGPLFFIVQK